MKAVTYLQDFFARDDINVKRQKNIDYAKTISICFMILIHVFMYPEYMELETSTFGRIIDYYMGGFMAAPIFMACMGVGLAYSKHNDSNSIIKRGIKLFVLAYILNILRCLVAVTYMCATNCYGAETLNHIIFDFFQGDILHFAGLALILFGLIKKFKHYKIILPIFALVCSIICTAIPAQYIDNDAILYTVGLIFPIGRLTKEVDEIICCFPLMSWFIVVIAGYCFALVLRKVKNLDKFYSRCMIIGLILAVPLITCEVVFDFGEMGRSSTELQAYMKTFYDFVFSFGFMLFDFGVLHYFTKITSDKLNKLNYRISNAINEIYCFSWILILNGPYFIICYIKYPTPEVTEAVKIWVYFLIFIGITVVSMILGICLKEYKTKRQHKKIAVANKK